MTGRLGVGAYLGALERRDFADGLASLYLPGRFRSSVLLARGSTSQSDVLARKSMKAVTVWAS